MIEKDIETEPTPKPFPTELWRQLNDNGKRTVVTNALEELVLKQIDPESYNRFTEERIKKGGSSIIGLPKSIESKAWMSFFIKIQQLRSSGQFPKRKELEEKTGELVQLGSVDEVWQATITFVKEIVSSFSELP